MPPMTTVAKGRCTSEPMPTLTAMGKNPKDATKAVVNTGRKRVNAPLIIAASKLSPAFLRSLINATFLCSRERQAHVLKLEDSLRACLTHVFDGFLITNVIRPLNGVIHMPLPLIIWIVAGNCTGNPTLCRNCVRARRENLGYYCCFIT